MDSGTHCISRSPLNMLLTNSLQKYRCELRTNVPTNPGSENELYVFHLLRMQQGVQYLLIVRVFLTLSKVIHFVDFRIDHRTNNDKLQFGFLSLLH